MLGGGSREEWVNRDMGEWVYGWMNCGWVGGRIDELWKCGWVDGWMGLCMGEEEGLAYRSIKIPSHALSTTQLKRTWVPFSLSNPSITGLHQNVSDPHASLLLVRQTLIPSRDWNVGDVKDHFRWIHTYRTRLYKIRMGSSKAHSLSGINKVLI